MPKDQKPSKEEILSQKQAVQFCREHLVQKFIEAGWSEPRAKCLVDQVKDEEIVQHLPKQKMGAAAVGGKWLDLLKVAAPKILAAVETIFKLISLSEAKEKMESGAEETEEEEEEEK